MVDVVIKLKGECFPDFEMLDARTASALRKIISITSFRKRVIVEEQRAQKKYEMGILCDEYLFWVIIDASRGDCKKRQFTVVPMTEDISPKHEYRFDNCVPNRLLEQTRISILSWNPGLRRGREEAIEELIAGKWNMNCAARGD